MSHHSTTTIRCDHSPILCTEKISGSGSYKAMLAASLHEGWQQTKKGRNLCPKHRTTAPEKAGTR
ncbi:hypothetical protein HOT31_gp019 [Microbacterium phage Hendrix]|uniref:Uncharacterized protein n=1 Tax=Microbacterium phage Hendrix TaxID=2182341 RepID=A0A2U8UU56_9CAUD|nr:hypothetical protein HOT31_gp019 [Microbacterium phage Hendrix]AWN07690.1 hypothetical protein PBI_HENDRIX_19 [Microbacterium phage Hendrix]